MTESVEINVIITKQNDEQALLCVLNYNQIVKIGYVARRGYDEEEGAVQRILTPTRINKIKEFILGGNTFPNAVILNWQDSELFVNNGTIIIPLKERAAQIIDGQHRIEGIKSALKQDPSLGEREIPVLFFQNIATAKCADIFLGINTEQKPVPKSLVYDLYAVSNLKRDYALDRARDLAYEINTDTESPYRDLIKFPGSKKRKGGIPLSSIINTLKTLVKKDGEFDKIKISTLDDQYKVLKNYFRVLQKQYGNTWEKQSNPFIFVSGFNASIDVLSNRLLVTAHAKKDFSEDSFRHLVEISPLINQSLVKGLSGDAAKDRIRTELEKCLKLDETTSESYKF